MESQWESPEAFRLRTICSKILHHLDACVAARKRLDLGVCTTRHAEHGASSPFYELPATTREGIELRKRVLEEREQAESAYQGLRHDADEGKDVDRQMETDEDNDLDSGDDANSADTSWGRASVSTIETNPEDAEFYRFGNVARNNWIEWLTLLENSKWTVAELSAAVEDVEDIVEEATHIFVSASELQDDSQQQGLSREGRDEADDEDDQTLVKFRRVYHGAESAWIENPWKYWSVSVLDPRIRGRLLVGPLRYPDGITGMAVGLSERCGETHNRIGDAARLYAPIALFARRYLQEGRGMEVFHIDQFMMQSVGYGRITQSVTYLHSTSHVARCKPCTRSTLVTVARGGCPNALFDSRTTWQFERPGLLTSPRVTYKINPDDSNYVIHVARTPGMILTGREAVSELILVVHGQDLGFVSLFVGCEQLIITTKAAIDDVRKTVGRRLAAVVDPAAMLLGDIREAAARIREEHELIFKSVPLSLGSVSFQDVFDHIVDVGFDGIARAAFRDFVEANPRWLQEAGERMSDSELQDHLVQCVNTYLNALSVDEHRKSCVKEAARVWYGECPPVPWVWVICRRRVDEDLSKLRLRLLKDWCMTADESIILSPAEHHDHIEAQRNVAEMESLGDSECPLTAYMAAYPDEGVDLDPDEEEAWWCLAEEALVVRQRPDKIVFKLRERGEYLPMRRGFELIHGLFLLEHVENESHLILRASAAKIRLNNQIEGVDITDFLQEHLTALVREEGAEGMVSPSWAINGVRALAGKSNLLEEDMDILADDVVTVLKDWILLAFVFGGYVTPKYDASCGEILQACFQAMEVIWPEPIGELREVIRLPSNCLHAEDLRKGYLSIAWDERSWMVAHGSVQVIDEANAWHLDATVGMLDYPLGTVSRSEIRMGDYWSTLQRTVEPAIRGDIRYLEQGLHTLREVLEILSTSYKLTFVTVHIPGENQWGLWVQTKFHRLKRVFKVLRSVSVRNVGIELDPTPVGKDEAVFKGSGWMITSLSDLEYVILEHVKAVDKEERSNELQSGAKELASAVLLAARLWKNLPITGFTEWLDIVGASQDRSGGFRVDKKARLPLCLGIAGRDESGVRRILVLLQPGSAYCARLEDIENPDGDVVTLKVAEAFVEDIASGTQDFCFYKQENRAHLR